MKLSTQLLTASALVMAFGSAHAANPIATLKVKGIILSPGCNISLSEGGVVDHKLIDRAVLTQESNHLPAKIINASVVCEANTNVKVKFADAQTAAKPSALSFRHTTGGVTSLTDQQYFGLGAVGGQSIGAYAIRVSSATVLDADNKPVAAESAVTETNTSTAFDQKNAALVTTKNRPYLTAVSGSSYASGKNFTFPLDVATTIVNGSKLPTGSTIDLQGIATLEVISL